MQRRELAAVLGAAVLAVASVTTVVATGGPNRSSGTIGYTFGSVMPRGAMFTVVDRANACTYAFVNGTYGVDLVYAGTTYAETLVLRQWGTSIASGYMELAGGGSRFVLSSGSVRGSAITFTGTFGATTVTWSGTIASNGSMAGTWTDVGVLSPRTGTWSTTSGSAVVTAGCTGANLFQYHDDSGNAYAVNVREWRVFGNRARFAGPAIWGTGMTLGDWLVIEVEDVGEPGRGFDRLGYDIVPAGAGALAEVQALIAGSGALDGGYTIINAGNIQVKLGS